MWKSAPLNTKTKFSIICLTAGIFVFLNFTPNRLFFNLLYSRPQAEETNEPIILFWTIFFSWNLTKIMNIDYTCPYKCHYTSNKSMDAQASARIFHVRDFHYQELPENTNALNVFFTLESPIHTYFFFDPENKKKFNDYFNLTLTYRSNSDLYLPYDAFIELDGNEMGNEMWSDEEIDQHIAKKSKMALLAISNCNPSGSNRKAYIDALSEYMNITKIGTCYNSAECNKECLDKLVEDHYFYFAFENTVCPEYTTEKFWRLKNLTVPIVLSRGAISPQIPSDSYIAASDFKSPKELADFLFELSKDKVRYKSYFNWTKTFKRTDYIPEKQPVMCNLCKMLHSNKKQIIKNYQTKWSVHECIDNYGGLLVNNYRGLLMREKRMLDLVKKTSRKRVVNTVT